MTEQQDLPPITTPVEVHGTQAWVFIARDYPLSSMVLTYAEANRLQRKLRTVLAKRVRPKKGVRPKKEKPRKVIGYTGPLTEKEWDAWEREKNHTEQFRD